MSNKVWIVLLSFCIGINLAVCIKQFTLSALIGLVCCSFALMLKWNEQLKKIGIDIFLKKCYNIYVR